jgi:signal transduction histidine kinase
MKIKSKLFGGFFIVISITVILGLIALSSLFEIGEHFEFLVEHDLNVIVNAQKLQKLVVDAETGQRGFIITGDESFLEPYHRGVSEFHELLDVEIELVSDNPSQAKFLGHLREDFVMWVETAAQPEIEAARLAHNSVDGDFTDVAPLLLAGTGKAMIDDMRNDLNYFTEVEYDLKNKRFEEVMRIESNAMISVIAFGITSIVIGIVVSVTLFRLIHNPVMKLKEGSDKTGAGEYVQLEVSGNDELSELTRSFNESVTNILQSKIVITDNLDKMKKQKAEIEKAEVLKDEFASMVTHELKTPLTPIKGYCEMLLDESFGTLSKDQTDFIKKIDSSTKLLERLIGDVLDAQKIDMQKMTFKTNSFFVNKFLSILKDDDSHMMKDKEIEFVVDDSLNEPIITDMGRLRQVLDNLIKNAVDFVPSQNGKIEVGANKEDGKIVFYVKDNGIGIPKDKQKHLFKKFFQVDTSQTRSHGGTGLGLSICRGIVEGLGGKIWLESEPGKGTTFSFYIETEK